MAIRLAVYCLLIGYLCLDLFVWKGPVNQTLKGPGLGSERGIAEAKAMGIAARVYYQPIYRAQVDERAREYLWKRGRTWEDTTEPERRFLREATVQQLIDELLLKIQIKVSPVTAYEVPDEVQEAEFRRFKDRYAEGELEALMEKQGWSGEEEAKMRLNARLQREVYLTDMLASGVSDEDALAFYEENKGALVSPERRQVRQVMIPALAMEGEAARGVLEAALERVVVGKEEFAKVAGEVEGASEAVDLGWVVKDRLPKDFAISVFGLPLNKPTMIQSKLGWHLVEVTGLEPAGEPSFEEVKESVKRAIQQERKEAQFVYFRRLMRLRAEGAVEIFEDVLYVEERE
ncbi:MAG: peptidylprolyl isomerase [Verrucomicrobiaceae bacterium]